MNLFPVKFDLKPLVDAWGNGVRFVLWSPAGNALLVAVPVSMTSELKNEAFFADTKDYAKFYTSKGDRYDWDRAPSTPCPKLVEDVFEFLTQRRRGAETSENEGLPSLRGDSESRSLGEDSSSLQNSKTPSSGSNNRLPYVYDLTNPAEEEQFVGKCKEHLIAQMPPNLVADLANPEIKWIIFINPPFATANTVSGETGKKSKDTVSMTTLREWMNEEGYGEASRELFTQFLFRISKEFKDKQAHLCMFSKLKYINSNNDQKIRDGFFQYQYERGFIFHIKCFYGATGNFPVGFLVWNLAKKKHLKDQAITLDVFTADVEKVGTKRFPSVERTAMLNKWCPRPKWDGKSVMPTFVSAFNLKTDNKDKRNHVAPGFLCSVSSNGDDFQHTNSVFILSAPYANAGAFSVTPENFERAMVLHAVKKIPKATWTNDRDAFYAPANLKQTDLLTPNGVRDSKIVSGVSREQIRLLKPTDPQTGLPAEFVTDCVVWSAFADSNYAVSLRNVEYQGRVWQIANQMYPFLLEEVRRWPCAHGDIAAQMAAANEDRFLAKWLAERERNCSQMTNGTIVHKSQMANICIGGNCEQLRFVNNQHGLSPESRAVMNAASALYRAFYANITHTPWMDWKIETWDVGCYQVRNAMKELGGRVSSRADAAAGDSRPPAEALRAAHDALRAKLLPQIYSLGFLNPDVEYYE